MRPGCDGVTRRRPPDPAGAVAPCGPASSAPRVLCATSAAPAACFAGSRLPDSRDTGAGSRPYAGARPSDSRSEEHTSELQSQSNLVCRLLLEKKKKNNKRTLLD